MLAMAGHRRPRLAEVREDGRIHISETSAIRHLPNLTILDSHVEQQLGPLLSLRLISSRGAPR